MVQMRTRIMNQLQAVARKALVKKVVFDELQFFRTNSTSQSGMCVKPKKVLNLMRPVWSVEFLRECG